MCPGRLGLLVIGYHLRWWRPWQDMLTLMEVMSRPGLRGKVVSVMDGPCSRREAAADELSFDRYGSSSLTLLGMVIDHSCYRVRLLAPAAGSMKSRGDDRGSGRMARAEGAHEPVAHLRWGHVPRWYGVIGS